MWLFDIKLFQSHKDMQKYIRPQTLEPGQSYLYQEKMMENIHQSFSVVIFSSHTACPLWVIVQDELGKKMRLPRDQLFSPIEPILKPTYDLA